MGEAVVTAVGQEQAPETDIVRDMLRKAALAAPVMVAVFGLVWGVDGALSTAYGIAIVLVNFALAAWVNAWAARISPHMLMGVALFGFLFRLAVLFVAFWVVRDARWMDVVPFGITVIAAHLGLLFWEMRHISASLAFPGLKPTPSEES
jgi:hypothetical protein